MASVQWWAERVDVLLASTEEGCVSLWRLHADLADDAKRPDALKRADISSMRKYFEKNIVESIDLVELEKVRSMAAALVAQIQACWLRRTAMHALPAPHFLNCRFTKLGWLKSAKMTSPYSPRCLRP